MEKIPILKMGRFLLVTVQVDMHDQLALQLQDDLTARIVSAQARGVLIDISSLDVVDSFIGRMISLSEPPRRGVRLIFTDKGPGIADIEQALKDGFTSGAGLGLGLSGARRLSNEFSIESKVGEGTQVIIARWR